MKSEPFGPSYVSEEVLSARFTARSFREPLYRGTCINNSDKKVKVSHSLIAVGTVESHCILMSTADERRSPFLSFCCLSLQCFEKVSIYCWVDRESFPVVAWRSPASKSQPYGGFLHHNRAALTTRLRRLSD